MFAVKLPTLSVVDAGIFRVFFLLAAFSRTTWISERMKMLYNENLYLFCFSFVFIVSISQLFQIQSQWNRKVEGEFALWTNKGWSCSKNINILC